jgi:hypothetical protein
VSHHPHSLLVALPCCCREARLFQGELMLSAAPFAGGRLVLAACASQKHAANSLPAHPATPHCVGCWPCACAPHLSTRSPVHVGSFHLGMRIQGDLDSPATHASPAGRSNKLPRLQLTAALLRDSGWYLPRAAAMPPLDFGAGAGCGWLAASAGAWVAGRPGQQLYCDVQEGAAAVNGERPMCLRNNWRR